MFEILGYPRVIPHPKLPLNVKEQYIPDFMVQNTAGLWEIFELKKPDTGILKGRDRRETFQHTFEGYYAQCREYSEFSDY